MRLDQSGDVGEIHLPPAGSSRLVRRRPDLALEHVLERRDGQRVAQDLERRRPIDESRVARIRLDLDAQIGAFRRDVEAVGELLDAEGRE
jgi:hypothetical protein